jgi:hypothetical protein
MSSPSVFILASGPARRANGEHKQLWTVDGEPVILRTVRHFAEKLGWRTILVTPHEAIVQCMVDNLKQETKQSVFSVVDVGSPCLMTVTVQMTQQQWTGQNLFLLGDVYFTDRGFRAIEEALESSLETLFYGRREPSLITGGPGEVFGWQFPSTRSQEMLRACDAARKQWEHALRAPYDGVGTPMGTPWQIYRYLNDVPLDQHQCPGNWVEINDFTDDFDSKERYDAWHRAWKRRFFREPEFERLGTFEDWEIDPDSPAEIRPLDYIVLSTGYSGTKYLARLLSAAGVICGHEAVFRHQVWPQRRLRADSSLFAVGHLDHPVAKGAKLVHLVRNPLDVISSWIDNGTDANNEHWARQFFAVPEGKSTEDYARRWVLWNEAIEAAADKHGGECVLVRAEDQLGILDALGLRRPEGFVSNPRTNTKRRDGSEKTKVTLESLGAEGPAVAALAARYGYNL